MRGGDAPSGQKGNAPPSEEAKKIPASTDGSVKKAFTGGDQGFLSLMLEQTEVVNHNTKKLRFKLPEEDMESGLPVACEFVNRKQTSQYMLTLHSCRYYQVQGPRDAEASYPTIHTD
jgi:cytochrome-b5 reductase